MKKFTTLLFFGSIFVYFNFYYSSDLDPNLSVYILFSLSLAILISINLFISNLKISSLSIYLIIAVLLSAFVPIEAADIEYIEIFYQASIGIFAFLIGSELSAISLFKRTKLAFSNYIFKLSSLLILLFILANSFEIEILPEPDILYSVLICVLILIPDPIFIKAFFENKNGYVYIEKLLNHRHVLQFFFSIIVLLLISSSIGNDTFNVLYFRSFLVGLFLHIVFRTIIRFVQTESILLFFLSFFVLTIYDYNIADLDFFVVYLFAGTLFNRNHIVSNFTNPIKSLVNPALLVIVFVFAAQISPSPNDFIIVFIFLLFKYVVVYLSNLLEILVLRPADNKYPYLKYGGLIQGVIGLHILQSLNKSFVIDAGLADLLSLFLVVNAVVGAFTLEYGLNLYDQEFQKSTDSKSDIDAEKIDIDNFPIFLADNQQIKRYINHLINTYKELQTDFLDQIQKSLFSHYEELIKDVKENYQYAINRLSKEILLIAEQEDEILKERIRDNRGKFAFNFQHLLNNYRKSIKSNEQVPEYSKIFFTKVEKVFQDYPVLLESQNDYNFTTQKSDNYVVGFIKAFKRMSLSIIHIFNKSAQFYHKIFLTEILLFHFYKRYSVVLRVLTNTLFQQHYDMLKKIHNIYKEVDNQFKELFIFLEKSDQTNLTDLNKIIEKNKRETERDIDLLTSDFKSYFETNRSFLQKGFNHWINSVYHDIALSGTFQYSSRRRRISQTYSVYETEQAATSEIIENWYSLIQSYFGHFSIDMDIRHVQNKTRKIVNHTIEDYESYLEKEIDLNIAETNFLIADFTSKIKDIDKHYIHNTIDGIKKKIVYQVKINLEKSIEHLKNSNVISISFNQLIENIHDVINELPNSYKISLSNSHHIKMSEVPDEIILVRVPFRSLCRTFMELEITQTISDINNQISVGLDNLVQMLNESIDDFSGQFEAVLDITDISELRNEIVRILDSLKLKVAEADKFLQSMKKSVDESLVREIVLSIQKVKQLTIDEIDKLIHEEIYKKKIGNEIQLLPFIKSGFETIMQSIDPYIIKLKRKIKSIKDPEVNIPSLKMSDILLVEDQLFADLPFMYRKLLSLEPVEIFEFLSNRTDQIETIKEAFSRWHKGLHSNVAIYGEMGNGKTSLVNCLIKHTFKDERVYRFKLRTLAIDEQMLVVDICKTLNIKESIITFESLKQKIRHDHISGIFIFESVQRILIKHIDGFDLIQKFHSFISSVSDHFLWINTYAYHSWLYLENVINVEDFYTYRIHLQNLNKDELRKLIENRNSLSGYRFQFDKAHSNRKSQYKFLKRKIDSIDVDAEVFFNKLLDVSKGNIYVAIFYWLYSLHDFSDGIIRVKQISEIQLFDFNQLDIEKLITLQTIIHQGGLTPEIHNQIFNCGIETSENELKFLLNIHFLKLKKNKDLDIYTVNKIAFQSIQTELMKQGLLH